MPEDLGSVWRDILPQIEMLVEQSNGSHTAADIFELIVTERCQLWRNELGIVLTSISIYPRARTCLIWGLAGEDIKSWLQVAEDTITAWARFHDCTSLELNGRRGWEKLLPDWKRRVLMRKEI